MAQDLINIEDLGEQDFEQLANQFRERQEAERSARKEAEKDKEIALIRTALDSGNYSKKRDRVAHLLNVFPDTRKSDVTLTLRYWETFQPDHFDGGQVLRNNLFKLERETTIARLRAKIQNEYGLFLPDENVIRRRRRQEDSFREEMLADRPPPNVLHVFADETGKNDKYLIIASVWFLNVAKTATFQATVSALAHERKIRGEFHFSESKKQHLGAYETFVDLAARNREFMSFKAIITKNPRGRDVEESVTRLLKLHLLKGFEHEIEANRLTSPRRINISLDEGATMSAMAREELKLDLIRDIKASCGHGNDVERIAELYSKSSYAIQLADLLAGALNRRFNVEVEQRNHKDDLADYVLAKLAPELGEIGADDAFHLVAVE